MKLLDKISSWLSDKIKDLELQEKYPMEDFKDDLPDEYLPYNTYDLDFSNILLKELFEENIVEDEENSIGVIFLKEEADKLNLITAAINKLSIGNSRLKFFIFTDCKDSLTYFYNLLKWGGKTRLIPPDSKHILSGEAFYLSGIDCLSKFKQVLAIDSGNLVSKHVVQANGLIEEVSEEAFVINCKDCFVKE